MEILDRIESQLVATRLPLVAITVAAVPYRDTPVILTLHWHGFVEERLAEREEAVPVAYRSVPSSALQLNDRWDDLLELDLATMEAAWELGAWDVARAERPSCSRPGAESREALECLQAFGAFPFGTLGQEMVIADAPDADELLSVAARAGYLMWLFRPVRGGIWGEVADDRTLNPDGTRHPPCPVLPVPPTCEGSRRTVYRFGRSGDLIR
ncbi:MAG: diguanylate cyclase [Betaproteobacteria bacterium]|nr:diguanylate cyclase [Betaproteobacteria bacterium]